MVLGKCKGICVDADQSKSNKSLPVASIILLVCVRCCATLEMEQRTFENSGFDVLMDEILLQVLSFGKSLFGPFELRVGLGICSVVHWSARTQACPSKYAHFREISARILFHLSSCLSSLLVSYKELATLARVSRRLRDAASSKQLEHLNAAK